MAVQPALADDQMTVGTAVTIRHNAATPVGLRVTAHTTLIAVAGRQLTLGVEAWDERESVGTGTHERVIVTSGRFQARADGKR